MPPVLPVLPLHLGALHPVEQALTFVLAFGPFVVLALVIWLRRRADAADETDAAGEGRAPEPGVRPEPEPQRER